MELNYRQINCQSANSGDRFDKGVQNYPFSIGGKTGWIPARSYFRIGVTVTGASDKPIMEENIALADSFCGNLFSNVIVRAGGQDISSIMNYCGQAQMLKSRTTASGAWLNTTGKQFALDADFQSRVSRTSKKPLEGKVEMDADGVVTGVGTGFLAAINVGDEIELEGSLYKVVEVSADETLKVYNPSKVIVAAGKKVYRADLAGNKNTQYFLWQPPVGFFDHSELLGAGEYRISLNPNTNYKTSAIEMLADGKIAGTDFDFNVDSMEFYCATMKADLDNSGKSHLKLTELSLQSKTLGGATQHDFTVPPSTTAISVFLQGGTAGSDVRLPPSMFKTLGGNAKLTSLQVSYANTTKPSTQWASKYDSTTQQMSQRYIDSQMYSGNFWNLGGTESLGDWLKRGAIYHFTFDRDASDRSTQVQVITGLDSSISAEERSGMNLFVAAHYTRQVDIVTELGFISEVVAKSV